MILQDLKEKIPFKWRIQSTNQYGCTCVAYIDARDVQDILDNVCGQDGWQCKYKEHKGNLFCSVGIDVGTWEKNAQNDWEKVKSNWVWKSDCGTESNIEKQKGESSDAFKRAAVMWGIGRFLYSLKIIKIKEVIKDGVDRSGKVKYAPALNGKKIWDINAHCNNLHKGAKPTTPRKPALTDDQYHNLMLPENKKHIASYLDRWRVGGSQRKELKKLIT